MRTLIVLFILGATKIAFACLDFSGKYKEKNGSIVENLRVVIEQKGCEEFKHLFIYPEMTVGIEAITDGIWRSSIRNPGDENLEHVRIKKATHGRDGLEISQIESYRNLETASHDIKYKFISSDEIEMSTHSVRRDGTVEYYVDYFTRVK